MTPGCSWHRRACRRGGSVGFELMDNARFGASQFAEQINYQRGLGELARSIESMHRAARPRALAMPRQSLFVRERQARPRCC